MLLKKDFPFNCKHCGQSISGPVKYCPFCGEALEVITAPPAPPKSELLKPAEEPSEHKVTSFKPEVVPSGPELMSQSLELKSSEFEINLPEYETAEAHEHEDDSWKDKESHKTKPSVTPKKQPLLLYGGIVAAIIIGILFVKGLFTNQPTPAVLAPVPTPVAEPAPSAVPAPVPAPEPTSSASEPTLPSEQENPVFVQRQKQINDGIAMGILYYQNKEYLKSEEKMRDVLALDSDNQVALSYIRLTGQALSKISNDMKAGISFYNKGQLELTIEKMNEVLNLDPDNKTARKYLAMAENKKRQRDEEFEHPVTGEVR
jgi:hypothetical protein